MGFLCLICSLPAFSAHYNLPRDAYLLPGSCYSFSNNVNCDANLNFGNNDTVTLSQNINWSVSGDFSVGNNFKVNQFGSASNLTITVAGNVNTARNAIINGNITVSGNINTQKDSSFNGNFIVTGTLDLAKDNVLTGNIQAHSLIVKKDTIINGNVSAVNVTLEKDTAVNGNINATGNMNIDNSASVSGYVNAPCGGTNSCGGTITLQCDQNNNIGACSAGGGNSTVAKYSMEQTGWSGSGSILDTSGNNNNGTPLGGVTPVFTDPQVSCKVAQIPANAIHTQLTAVDTGVDVNTLGSQGSIAFWYRSNQAWDQVAAGTRKMLFDASAGQARRFSLYLSGISTHEGRLVFHGSEGDNDNIYLQSDTKFSFDNNTWVHIALTWDATADRIKLYINGSEESLSQVVTNTAFDEGLADLGTLIFGDAKSTDYSQSGGTPHPGNAADGYIDEIQLFDYELSSSQVNTVRSDISTCNLPPPQAIAKYELSQISFDGSNSILDTSGNNNHASPVGSLASVLPNPQKSCRAADVPYNNTTSSSAIDTGLDLDSDIGSKGTIAFWYKSDSAWANGNDRKLIDASNYTSNLLSSKAFYGTLTSAGRIEFGLEGNNDNDLVVQTSVQSYGAGQWVHIAFTWDVADQELEIYLNGTKQNLSYVHNQGITSPLIDLDTLYIGDNRDSYDSFESNTNNSADGVFDEIYIYDGVLNSATINTIKDAITDCVCSVNGLTGSYYSGYTNSNSAFPTSTPTLTRVDSDVAFNWGGGSPGTGVGNDDFAVVWQGTVQAPVTGSITFSTYTDDGVRLWVDGQLLIDDWRDKSPNRVTAPSISLTAGQHYAIRMEYYENGGGAVAQLEWQYSGQSRQTIPNQYLFACNGPVVSSVVLQCNEYDKFTVNFDVVGNASISNAELQNLSRYILKDSGGNTLNLSSATALSSTSVRLSTATNLSQDSSYTLTVTDLEDTDGNQVAPNPTNFQFTAAAFGLTGYYYNNYNRNNPFPTGTPVLTRTDSIVDFNWSTGNPGGGVNSNNFAVTWAGQVVAPVTGNYTFSTVTDDGVRLFLDENQNNSFDVSGAVNNERIINRWVLQGATRRNATRTVYLNAGERYNIRMEYFENGGDASAQLEWQYPGQGRQVIPTQYLRPVCQASQINHYRLIHPQKGYTCTSTEVEIKACANSDCSIFYNDQASLNLTADNGTWVGGSNVLLTNGSGTKQLSNTDDGSVSVIGAANPSPSAPVVCYVGNNTSDCGIPYSDDSLSIVWEQANNGSIPNQIAQKTFGQGADRLLLKSSCSSQVPQGNQLSVAVECVSPGSCQNSTFAVGGSITGTNPAALYTIPNVSFDQNGELYLAANLFRYDDAGQIKLRFEDSSGAHQGATNTFVVTPAYFELSVSTNPDVSIVAGDKTKGDIAAKPFTVSIEAKGYLGAATKNYQPGDVEASMLMTVPAAGESAALQLERAGFTTANISSNASINFESVNSGLLGFNNGESKTLVAKFPEVGTYTLNFRDNNYFNTQFNTAATVSSGNVDYSRVMRFKPAYFTVNDSKPSLLNKCVPTGSIEANQFSYIGETLEYGAVPSIKIIAMNHDGNVTKNYADGVWSLAPTLGAANPENNDYSITDQTYTGSLHTVHEVELTGDKVFDGQGDYTFIAKDGLGPSLQYVKDISNPHTPFNTDIAIEYKDDFFKDNDVVCYRTDYGQSGSQCASFQQVITGKARLRYGRLTLANVVGSASNELPVPIQVQYYATGGFWETNTLDTASCSHYSSANARLVNVDFDETLPGLKTKAKTSFTAGQPLSPTEGIVINQPGAADDKGTIRVIYSIPADLEHLKMGNDELEALATFGQFRGNDRVIHWREVFND